jgi:hypothetical protein
MDVVQLTKDPERQRPIPTVWRRDISEIVGSIAAGDYRLSGARNARPVSDQKVVAIEKSISAYGARVISAPEETWRTSVCQWMNGYWDALVDLFTVEEGSSDLVLSLRVYETGDGYSFEIQSIHVP